MRQRVPPRPRAEPPRSLEDLRPLIVGPEQDRIQALERRLDQDLGNMVAEVLPAAIVTTRKKSDELAWALEPILESAVRETVRKDPVGFAEALAPAIGPAIRGAVARAIQIMIQRFNEALNNSLTVASLRWRVEAARTGRPYAEVVLLRTLVYRVEQLFLIHRDTGLLIEHRAALAVPEQNAEQIAAMLSALTTFTREAFHEDARLERFRVGEFVGWVENGPSAILVAMVRGTAPESYEVVLREALERVHLEFGEPLVAFRGDVAPLADAGELLSDCLREQHAVRRGVVTPRRAGVALLVAAASAALLWIHASVRDSDRLNRYVVALRSEPGFVVTRATRRDGRYLIAGLRDPLAADPASIWRQNSLDPGRATAALEAFYSLDPRLVQRRATLSLRPPPGVELSFENGTLVARGAAPEAWIAWVRSSATLVPGVSALDAARLYSEETVARADALVESLGRTELLYPLGSDRLPASQRAVLATFLTAVKRLFELAPQIGRKVRIEVVGYADASGADERNQEISQARAEGVAAELVAAGIAHRDLVVRGAGVRSDVLPPACAPPLDEVPCDRVGGAARARGVTLRASLLPAKEA